MDWAQCACTAANKSSGSKTSQLAAGVLDVDVADEEFHDWCGSRLDQTLGTRVVAPPSRGNGGGGDTDTIVGSNRIMQPIFNVNVPPAHTPTVDEMDLAFHRGADAQKRASEVIVTTGTKFSTQQMVHLLAFCGLDASTRDELPAIWVKLQTTKDWFSASTELVKWFSLHTDPWDIGYQFHKELVDDIRKLQFSLGQSPLADNAHRGISILAFVLMSVAEETQLREE